MQMSAKQKVPHETWLKNGKLKMTKKNLFKSMRPPKQSKQFLGALPTKTYHAPSLTLNL